MTSPAFAIVHKKTQYFVDVEVTKDKISIECSDHPENNTSYLGFDLLDQDVFYSFHYRRPLTPKMCKEQKAEYLEIIKPGQRVRVVGIEPSYELMKDSILNKYPQPFKATNSVMATFIRLQANNKCKAYFSEHCELPKNYWGGVIPGE
jgi:hypothetical protein